MFGRKKKAKQDGRTTELVGLEIGCFLSWYADTFDRMEEDQARTHVVTGFLRAGGLPHDNESVQMIEMVAMSFDQDPERMRKARKATGWDTKVQGFLNHCGVSIDEQGNVSATK